MGMSAPAVQSLQQASAWSEVISVTTRSYRFVVERDPETTMLVGYVPGWPGAHSQGADIDELQVNLREVIENVRSIQVA